MQAYIPPDQEVQPPAIVRPAEDLPRPVIRQPATQEANLILTDTLFAPERRTEVAAAEEPALQGKISNRPQGVKYRVAYVNGIQTSEVDAQRAANLLKTCLGVEDCECTVIYNPSEHLAKSSVKILGASISSRLGQRAEPQSVTALANLIRESLHDPDTRLFIAGHSQGTLIIQNALDRVYDECRKSPELLKLWESRTPSWEIIMYAPIVRTLPPGFQAVSLLNSYDAPARGFGLFQKGITYSKHYLGYREHQNVRTIIYNPESNQLPDLFFDPGRVHESFQLLIDNPDFNFRLLAEDPSKRNLDSKLFARNLATSIKEGRRSDFLHYELIIEGCARFGPSFTIPFSKHADEGSGPQGLAFGNFLLSGQRFENFKRAVKR